MSFLERYRKYQQELLREKLSKTQCPFCSMQCKMMFSEEKMIESSRYSTTPDGLDPVSEGKLCIKGVYAHSHALSSKRLRTPMLRTGDSFTPISWEEAYRWIKEKVSNIQGQHGNDAMSVFGSGALTNEKSYLLGKFARIGLGTRNIDYNGRYCMSAAAGAANLTFGVDRGMNNPIADIPFAQCIVLGGTNLADCQPTMMPYFRRAKSNGSKIILIDPRESNTSKIADLHLKIKPGTDAALVNGLLKVIVDEDYVNQPFLQQSVEGYVQLIAFLRLVNLDDVTKITGVPKIQIIEAARLFGRAQTGMVLTGRGVEQHASGVMNTRNYMNLSLLTGKIGQKGSGYGSITGQGNGQGSREHGQKADQLAGYRLIENPEHRRHIARIWGVEESKIPGKGVSAYELFEAIHREEIHGMIVLGSNPLVSSPNAHFVEDALRKLDALIVIDILMSETAHLADLVLPGSTYLEEEGTMTNLEGRVILRRAARALPRGAKLDWRIICDMAKLLGKGEYFSYTSIEQIFEELRLASQEGIADYAGITYQRIEEEKGLFWPCPSESHPGTPRLFTNGRFFHADGKARVIPVPVQTPKEPTDSEYPFILTTGRVMMHYQSGVQTRITPELNQKYPLPFVEINRDTAASLGLKDGGIARVRSRRGEMVITVKYSTGIRADTLFIPFHWGKEHSVNRLTLPELDPHCKMPEFKACAVSVTVVSDNSTELGKPLVAGGLTSIRR